MKWSDKTKEQYGAHCSLIMGGDNEHELHLSEDELNTLTLALQLVVSWANDDEYPAPDTPDTWEEVKEFIKNDLQSILELQQNIEKIDVSDIKLMPLTELNKKTIFKFVEDSEDFSFNVYKNSIVHPITGIGHLYGSKVYDASEYTVLDGEHEIVAEPFAATVTKPIMRQFPDFITPAVYSYNEESGESSGFDNSPRIFYNNGVKSTGATYFMPAQNGFSSENQPDFLQFTHLTQAPVTSNAAIDFHFGECQTMGLGSTPNNLFSMYWQPYYDELYNPDTRTMVIKVNLNAADINTFNFYDTVMIKNRRFRVNKIDYKPNDLSVVEFILIP